MVTVFSNVSEGYNANEVVEALKEKMKEYEKQNRVKDGLEYRFTGQMEEQAKEMAFLSKALMIAVFLILVIIVAQFNSYSMPSVIMITVLLSLIGVLLGLHNNIIGFIVLSIGRDVLSQKGLSDCHTNGHR